MNLGWLRLLRKKKNKETKEYDPLASYYDEKTLDELVKMYNSEEQWLKYVASEKGGKLSEEDYETLKRIENEIIKKTPDEFEKKVLRILADKKFNIVGLMNKKWDEEIRAICYDICHFFKQGPSSFKPLPFSGHELFSWLLSNTGDNEKDRFGNISRVAAEEFKNNRLMGYDFSEDSGKEPSLFLESIGGKIIVVFVGEFAPKTAVLTEIWKMEGGKGKEYLENMLKDMP